MLTGNKNMLEVNNFFNQIESSLYLKIAQPDNKNIETLADTWSHYLKTLREAIAESNTAKQIAQKDYKQAQALAIAWEQQMQIALSNSSEAQVHQALAHKQLYTARARQLQTLVERHIIHISTLKNQLSYWENQPYS
jgi:phage shock protein A